MPCQASTVLAKRGFPEDLGASQGALATAFPRALWLSHLLPSLQLREAVSLRTTCKALRAIVAEMPADLGIRPLESLQRMLTCFPKAWRVELRGGDTMTQEEQDSLLAWLKGRENFLTHVGFEDSHLGFEDSPLDPFHRRAWRAGVFKRVKGVTLWLDGEDDKDLIIEGFVSGVESLGVHALGTAPQVERLVMGYIRTFRALTKLECSLEDLGDISLPPSLEVLELTLHPSRQPVLLGGLAPMIESSGAKLRRLKLTVDELTDQDAARGVGSLFRACAPTLREASLLVHNPFESAKAVAEGLAACPQLERVSAPMSTFRVMPLDGSVIFHVSHLVLDECDRVFDDEATPDFALWRVMARGGFPSLSSLSLEGGRYKLDGECGPAMAAAFEGVADTLKKLVFYQDLYYDQVPEYVDPVRADATLVRIGEALGKLRRLETLDLNIGRTGLACYRLAQGMGEGACPALRSLTCYVDQGAAWLAARPSVILPSVQDLCVELSGDDDDAEHAEMLAMACALTSLGYRGSLVLRCAYGPEQQEQMLELLEPLLSDVTVD
jgi:hypothetical protein